jgi:hypothetical protein
MRNRQEDQAHHGGPGGQEMLDDKEILEQVVFPLQYYICSIPLGNAACNVGIGACRVHIQYLPNSGPM